MKSNDTDTAKHSNWGGWRNTLMNLNSSDAGSATFQTSHPQHKHDTGLKGGVNCALRSPTCTLTSEFSQDDVLFSKLLHWARNQSSLEETHLFHWQTESQRQINKKDFQERTSVLNSSESLQYALWWGTIRLRRPRNSLQLEVCQARHYLPLQLSSSGGNQASSISWVPQPSSTFTEPTRTTELYICIVRVLLVLNCWKGYSWLSFFPLSFTVSIWWVDPVTITRKRKLLRQNKNNCVKHG